MNEIGLLAALLAGLLGSGHCVAMCGALAAGPGAAGAARRASSTGACTSCGWRRSVSEQLAYNAGRITSYAVAGALVGAVGFLLGTSAESLASRLVAGLPVGLAVRAFTALVLVLVGMRMLLGWSWLRFPEQAALRVFARVVPPLSRRIGGSGKAAAAGADATASPGSGARTARVPRGSLGRHWLLGMLWGWLPCGLSYSMLLVALAAADAAQGALLMLAFGAGTLPALMGVGLAGRLAAPMARSGGPASVVTGWALVMFGAFVLATTSTPMLAMARAGGGADAAAFAAPSALPDPGAPFGPMCRPLEHLPR